MQTKSIPDHERPRRRRLPWLVMATLDSVTSLLRRRFARDVVSLQLSNTAQRAMTFAASVALARLLGSHGYGEYLLVVALFTSVNVIGNLGLGQFLVTRLAEAHAAGNREEVRRLAGYQLKVALLVTGLLALFGLGAGPWLGSLYGRMDLGMAARILFVGAPLTAVLGLFSISLQAVRRMKEVALLENVTVGVGTIGGVLGVLLGMGVSGPLIATVLGNALACVAGAYCYWRLLRPQYAFPELGALLTTARDIPLGTYFRFSFLAVLDKNVASLYAQTPVLFLGRWGSLAEVTAYGIATNMFALLGALHGAVSRSLAVRLSEEKGRGSIPRLRSVLWRVSGVWGAASLAIAAGFAALQPLFALLYGADKMPPSALIWIYALYMAKLGFTVGLGSIFLVLDRVLANLLVKAPVILLGVPLGVVLVQRFGGVGAALYLLLSYLFGDLLYVGLLKTAWFWREPSGQRTTSGEARAQAPVSAGSNGECHERAPLVVSSLAPEAQPPRSTA